MGKKLLLLTSFFICLAAAVRAAVTISSFSPTTAAVGATVTINGTGFTGATVVTFGGTAAASYVVNGGGTQITAVVGNGSNGSVSVTSPSGVGSLAGFTIAVPTISSFTPTSSGNSLTVTITGTNFIGASVVKFGGTAATSFTVVSSTSITAVVAGGTSGSVTVTTPGGTATLAGFTWVAAPTITSFTPTSSGNTLSVVITGTNFTGATAVSFGGTAATSFAVNSATQITAVVGAGTSGNVSVTTAGGTATLAGFTWVAAPTITSFTPTSSGNGLSVVITGTNLNGATAVSFGGTAATSFVVNSATQITAVVGAGTSGSVSVTTAGGTGTKAGFTWVAAPTITSFTPTSAASGATVTITGTNFTGATAVSFGGTAATSYTVVSATSITAVVAAGTSGSASVTTAGGTATLAGFTFIPAPTISSFTPTSAGTGTTVTITGTNFTGATAVSFGGTAATSYTVVSSTSITAVVAAGTSGSVSVTSPGGTGSLAGFTYSAPNAYIYIHQKTLNEQSAVDFTYTLTGTSNYTFSLNNNPSFIQIGDIGAGHGTTASGNGDGEVWIIGNSASASYNVAAAGLTGGIYRRPSASAQWAATNVTTNVTAVDGAYYNQCVYILSGNVYFYYAGTSTQIYASGNATDVTAGGGNIAIVAGGAIQVYNKQYVAGASINTNNGGWTTMNGGLNTTTATRLDLNLAGTSILSSYVNGTTETIYSTVITVSGGTGSAAGNVNQGSVNTITTFTRTTDANGNNIGGSATNPDVAFDDKGFIYAMASSQIFNAGDAVYSNTSGSFVYEPQSRAIQRITASSGGQAWGVIADGTANTIWARNTDGTHIWIDDERVRVSGVGYTYKTGGGTGATNTNSGAGVSNGNVIMIPVPAGTYTVSETLPDATWDLGRFSNYVPATSSVTTSVSGQSATVTVAAGDVVHLQFFNEKLSPKAIALTCSASILEDFGVDGTGTKTFGDTVQGTAYHYYPQGNGTPTGATAPQDGKYYLVKDLTHWFINNGLQSHTNAGTGYYLLVNASYAQDEFYRKRVTNLVPGLQYQITFYAANVNFTTGTTVVRIPPNVSYGLQDANGNFVASATTGSIDTTGPTQWDLFSFTFTASTSQADFFLRNNNIGGLGNDIALDDISLNPVITPLPNITVSPTIAPNVCIGTNYTFSNSQSGGIWTASPTTVATINAKSGKAKGLTAGTAVITYTYTNAIGCVSANTTGIIVTAAPTLTTSDLLGGTSCKNQTDSLYGNPSGGVTPYTYAWVASPTGTDGLGTANIQNTTAKPTVAGTYSYNLTVTDAVGCAASSGVSVTVSSNPAPVVLAGSNSPYCTLKAFSLTSSASGGSGSYTYLWSATPTGNGLVSTNVSGPTAIPTAAGNYVYKVVVNDGFCNVPAFVNVTVNASPSVTVTGPGTTTICNGGTIALTSTPSGGTAPYTYAWTGTNTPTTNGGLVSTNVQNTSAKPAAGTYTYTLNITDANNCTASNTANATVSFNANSSNLAITAALSPSTTTICAGTAVGLNATVTTAGTPNYTYVWSGGPGTISNANSGSTSATTYNTATVSTAAITTSTTGAYTLTVTDSKGCVVTANTAALTVNPKPSATASSFGTGLCNSGVDSVYAAVSGGTAPYSTYAWAVSPNSGGISISTPSNDTSAVTGGNTSQLYTFTVTVTDSKNCTATGSTGITRVNATGPSISTTNTAATYCVGSTINLAANRTNGTSAFTYVWSTAPATGGGLVLANATTTTAVPTATGRYVYTVRVTDANGCAAAASTPTQVVNSAVTVTTVSSAPGFCGGTSSATIVAVPSGGSGTYSNYAWSTAVVVSPGSTSVNPTSSTTSPSTTASITGATPNISKFSYTATVTDNNGCSSGSASTVLVVGNTISLSTPVATIPSACVGQTFTLNSTSFTGGTTGFNYTWSAPTGVTVNTSSGTIASSPVPSTTALASVAGNYTFGLLVVDALNCTASASTVVKAITQVSPSISATCGNTGGVEWVNLLEGNGASWAWTTTSGGRFYTDATLSPASDGTTSALQAPYVTFLGDYSVSITDANGCTGNGTYTITAGTCSVTLAVSKLDFAAQKQGGSALLTWSTATELNNNRFEVERSGNGTNWQVIGTVKSKGNSNTLTKYSFTDALPLNGINYYRLRQINNDGGQQHSQIEKLQFTGQWVVKMYPNPAQSFIGLEFNNDKDEKAAIVIQNAQGSTIFTTTQQLVKGLNRITLNQIQPLAQGTYIITLGTNGNIFRSKFVKGGY